MKTKLLGLLLALAGLSAPALAREGHENGNAGDIYAIEFKLTARDLVQRLRLVSQSDLQGVSLNKLVAAIVGTTVSSEEHVFLNGYEVNAKNIPDENIIVVNRSWWRNLRVPTETRNRLRLVLHEYLPIMGIMDEGAQISERLIALLDIKNYDPNRWWNPLNPANHLSMQLEGAKEGCQVPSVEFDLAQSEEDFTVETTGDCDEKDYRKIVIHKSSYSAPPSTGYRGTIHMFQIAVIDRNSRVMGTGAYRPKIAECLAPDDGTCALGGSLFLGDVSFQFWLLRDAIK